MVSFEVHWPRRAATWLGLLAALAVPCSGSSQPPADDDEFAQLAEQVLETQTRGGAYAKELIDPLTTLSFLYEENGDHSLAAAVTEQALQVIRANYGLRTLEQAPLKIADWELLFGNRPAAQDLYEQVHAFLEQHGDMQDLIDEIFSPATPVVLPTFVSSSLAADPSPSSTGHIDVAFEITQYGKARRIEILDTTRNASRAARYRLVRLIGESRFRPRIVDGQFARAAPVVLRDIPPDVTVDEQPIRSIREVGPARRHDAPEG